jgi:uncharacterized protein (TIGR02466 family)
MQRIRAFATDVVIRSLDAVTPLLPSLRDAILAERARSPGLAVSQVGGWHSVPDLAQRASPPYRPLMDAIVGAVNQVVREGAAERGVPVPPHTWAVQAWAIVLDPGGYNRVHDHAESHWSVACYVDAGDGPDDGSGQLSLIDPRRGTPKIPGFDLYSTALDISPRTGDLVIFPGYLQHMVHPYRGTRPRICVSANLSLHVQPSR